MRKAILFIGLSGILLVRCGQANNIHDHGDHSHDHNSNAAHSHWDNQIPHNHQQVEYTISPDSIVPEAGTDSNGIPDKSIQTPE